MAQSLAMKLETLAIMLSLLQYAFAGPAYLWGRQSTAVPSYVLSYAPLVWLHSQDPYGPSDIASQLVHTRPEDNFTVVGNAPNPLTLNNLDSLNSIGGGSNIYLTSVDDITANPSWLKGVAPDSTGKTNGATSCAIVVNDHGSGKVDAFYLYFYAFNRGNIVLGQEVGDHVGDWEHNMIRFNNGVPQAVWYSQHSDGEAFTYGCLEKQGQRPVVYSAEGSHANYATPGDHDHTIPNLNLPVGPLEDHCDRGKLWDPTLSAYSYRYDAASNTFTPYDASYPTNWLYFTGKWGDQKYPKSDRRQKTILGIDATAKYSGGPTGPRDKQLNRANVCPTTEDPCFVSPFLRP